MLSVSSRQEERAYAHFYERVWFPGNHLGYILSTFRQDTKLLWCPVWVGKTQPWVKSFKDSLQGCMVFRNQKKNIVIVQRTLRWSWETLEDCNIPHPQSSLSSQNCQEVPPEQHLSLNWGKISSSLVCPLDSGAATNNQKSPREAAGGSILVRLHPLSCPVLVDVLFFAVFDVIIT